MKNSDNGTKRDISEPRPWKLTEQQPTDTNSININKPLAESRAERKTRIKREVIRIRQINDRERIKKRTQRRNLKAALARLSSPEQRRAFLAARRAETKAAAQAAKEAAAERRREIAALTLEERKAELREERYQRTLRRMASRAYIPLVVMMYTVLAALAAGVIYSGLVAYGVFIDNSYAFQHTGQAISRPPDQNTTAGTSGASTTIDPYSLLLSQADLDFMKNRVNILVMGIDNSDERGDSGSYDRTDTMLLLSVDFETNNAYIISLPRDSYVWIYNRHYRNRINTAFGAGGGLNGDGFEYAMNTVSMLLGGIPVNNYVCFDMDVVMDVVNAMDGIDYDVDVSFTLDGRGLNEGFQHLNGQQVLDYCRVRENITGGTDIARTGRQRNMIMAIFKYMKDNGQLQDIPAIYSAVASNIYTDLTFEQITSLAAFTLKLDTDCLHDYLLPGKYLDMEGASFWGINQSKKKDMIYEIFGQTIRTDSRDDVYTLLALAEKKKEAIAEGNLAISDAEKYIAANCAYITADQRERYDDLKQTLKDAMAAKKPHDIESTIGPIEEAADALNKWLENTLKPAVEAAMATATPTPGPTDSSEPSPSESADPSGSPSTDPTTTPIE